MHPSLQVLLCAPRGFCAGVHRAIAMVEAAIAKHGTPVYVRHEIVHNKTVVSRLEAKGAIFVESLSDIPDTSQPVIFSAHGVSKAVEEEALNRTFYTIDATCPLVSKVHHEAQTLHAQGYHIVMIGHKGHPEVEGTLGQIPAKAGTLIETPQQAATTAIPGTKLALVTQTTLSVSETEATLAALLARFPTLKLPKKSDICYATTNRQNAIKTIAPRCDAILIVGAPNSSNSRQLVSTALASGCPQAHLIESAAALTTLNLAHVKTLGLSAGASAPEDLVQSILHTLSLTYHLTVEEVTVAEETQVFKIPQSLAE